MKMKKTFLLSAMALAVLGACTNDEYEGRDMAGSQLAVSASINEVRTRVSDSGTEWTMGDVIGVSDDQANANFNVPYTTANGNGVFAPVSEGIYVLGGNTINFSAYYPYDEALSGNTISFNVTEEGNHDYMYASATATRENPDASFVFNHMMTKLTFTFNESTVAPKGTELTWAVNGVTVDGTFDVTTGTVTAGSTKGSVGKSATVGAVSSVILPSLAEANTEPVIFSLTIGGKYYEGSITPALAASTDYQYELDLSQLDEGEPLNISQPTLNGWTPSEGGGITLEESAPKNAVIEVGDFYLNDGTTIDKSVVLTAEMKEKVVGVVFYAGNPQPSGLYGYDEAQDALLREHPTCTNGLVLALNNAVNGDAVSARYGAKVSGTNPLDFAAWLEAESLSEQYIATTLNVTSASDRMLGYNNTKVIELSNADTDDEQQIFSLSTDFMAFLNAYRAAVELPESTSGWYLPSYAELTLVKDNYETVSASIEAAGGTLPQYPTYNGTASESNEMFYWSSDVRSVNYAWVSPMVDVDENTNLYITKTSNGTKGFYRFAFAF